MTKINRQKRRTRQKKVLVGENFYFQFLHIKSVIEENIIQNVNVIQPFRKTSFRRKIFKTLIQKFRNVHPDLGTHPKFLTNRRF